MFCGNCGAQLPDDAKFCGTCGAIVENNPVRKPVQPAAPVRPVTPVTPRPVTPAPVPPKKAPKKNTGLLIGGIAGGVVVVALVLVLVLSLFGGDAAKVAKAAAKTADAYAEAAEKLNLPDVTDLAESGEYSLGMSVWLENMEYYEELSGIGARLSMDVSTKDKVIGMNLTPYLGSADIVDLQAKIDNSEVYVGSEELTGGKFYSMNTETLGEDLVEFGADDYIESLGFNIFTVMEQMKELTAENKEAFKIMEDADKALVKAIEVEKTGKETVDVNDNDVKCTVYHVMIPEDALSDYMGAVEDAYDAMNTTDGYLEILESMGIPDDILDEVEYSMGSTDDVFDAMDDVLDELGDVELDVYISGGYIMSIYYEGDIDGTDVEVTLDLGGGKNYVDDLSFEFATEYGELVIVSSGDHSGKDGEFTDKTTVDMDEDGYEYNVLTSKMTYDPNEEEDNLSWTIANEYMSVKMEGTMTGGKNSALIRLDEVSVVEYDEEVICFGMEYSVGSYAGDNIKISDSVSLAGMSEDELYEEAEELSEYVMAWGEKMMEKFPELMYYLG